LAIKNFDVTGMTCSSCAAHVERSVRNLQGVSDVSVNLLSNSMTVEFDDKILDEQEIVEAVRSSGYDARPAAESQVRIARSNDVQTEIIKIWKRLVVSIVFAAPLLYFAMGHMIGLPLPGFFRGHENALVYAFTQFLLVLPIIIITISTI